MKFMVIRLLWDISIPCSFCIKYYANSVSSAQEHFLLIHFTDIFCAKASSVQGQTLQEIFCHTFLVLQTNLSREIITWCKTDKEPQMGEFIIAISKWKFLTLILVTTASCAKVKVKYVLKVVKFSLLWDILWYVFIYLYYFEAKISSN